MYTFLVSNVSTVPIVKDPPIPNRIPETLACVLLSDPFIKFCDEVKKLSVLFATRPIAVVLAPTIVPVLYPLATAVELALEDTVALKNNFFTPVWTIAVFIPLDTAPDLSPVTRCVVTLLNPTDAALIVSTVELAALSTPVTVVLTLTVSPTW